MTATGSGAVMDENTLAAGPSPATKDVPSWTVPSVRWADVVRLLAAWVLSFLALLLTAKILPGFTYTSWLPLLVAAAVTGLVGMIVRPVLVELSAVIGWIAVALATLFGQALVIQLALSVVPGV